MRLTATILTAVLLGSANWVMAEETNATPDAPAAAPKLVCAEPSYDFGTADSGQTIDHVFTIKNEGTANLEIGNVRPSCGCTVANISLRSVPPGGETTVEAKLSLAGRSGQQHKTILVESNDPQTPQFTLTMHGTVAVAVEARPDRIIFGQIRGDATPSSELQLVGSGTPPFTITGIETSAPNLEVTAATVEEGKSYRLSVKVNGPLPEGPYNAFFRVRTDHPQRASIDIPVAAVVVGDVVVAPTEIVLPADVTNEQTRYVIVRSSSDKAFELTGVEPPDPSVKVQIFPFGANGYRIQLDNLRAGAGLEDKLVKIKTNVESKPEIVVPLRFVGSAPAPSP